ncbi:hypothetical protein [Salinicola aestuarinus]|uniref:hypothetical protein n=1 Tax=Salinicola aestuarinus TaxID=1949082 RepID=UPI000DA204BC|nr:hypothetical protein [Salinicola aestuarinus]
MSRASIFDQLHRRQSIADAPEPASSVRSDYDTETLRLIDGVALTPAGFVGRGSVPDADTPALSETLYGSDGYRLLVHAVGDVMPLSEPRLSRLEVKAARLHELVETILIEALMLLEGIPEESAFDVVLELPLRSADAASFILERVRDAIKETQFGEWLSDIRHQSPLGDPHAATAVGTGGGMDYVLWISADSLLTQEGVTSLARRGLLAQSSRGAGLYPGEAVAALLMERLLPERDNPEEGWLLARGLAETHGARAGRRDHDKRQALQGVLERLWPEADAASAPSGLVVDSMGLKGRAVELGGAIIERWPELDAIDDGVAVDGFCGWPGDALVPLMLVLAIAPLALEESAVVLGIGSETETLAWAVSGTTGHS